MYFVNLFIISIYLWITIFKCNYQYCKYWQGILLIII
jgi:hypothetical protein